MVGAQTPPLTCAVETPSPRAPTPCSLMALWASLLPTAGLWGVSYPLQARLAAGRAGAGASQDPPAPSDEADTGPFSAALPGPRPFQRCRPFLLQVLPKRGGQCRSQHRFSRALCD